MSKFKKDLKNILLYVAGSALLFNAGFDISRWAQDRQVKRAAAASMTSGEFSQVAKADVKWCTLAPDVGFYVCDVEVTLVDGKKGRLLQVFSNEDLAGK